MSSWRQLASCKGVDPEVFFPGTEEDAEQARRICSGCPVRRPCLEHALSAREREGIWGGLTERERRRLSRHWRQSA